MIPTRQLKSRETSRDLSAELIGSVDDMLAGRAEAMHHLAMLTVLEARQKTELSQQQLANILHISKRSLQDIANLREQHKHLFVAMQRTDVIIDVLV